MPKLDVSRIPEIAATGYPPRYAAAVAGRRKQRLGDSGGLSQFGVNLTTLAPGAASALRHWHRNEDEFVYMLRGAAVLVEDDGETVLGPGDAACFPAGAANGHQLVNRSDEEAVFLEVGTRAAQETVVYSEQGVDLQAVKRDGVWRYLRRDGTPW
jgi:uncharacterized cupin superfamily protein